MHGQTPRVVALAILLLAGCTTNFNRFQIGDDDMPDAGTGDGDGDGDGHPGDDDMPGAGTGDSDGDGDGDAESGDGDGPAAECETDVDCRDGFACSAGTCTFVPPRRVPNALVQTAGGGVTAGSDNRLQLRIGAPAPMGRMHGGTHQLIIGPLSGRAAHP